MNEDATLNDNVPTDFVGMDRFEAREALITLLEDKKLIEKKEPYTISAGHCYRCHTIVEPRLSLQWFVRMKPLAEKAIKVVEKDRIKFYPQRWKKVYLNWMYNIQDWCISRQIWWGHRLPVYYCRSCQKPIVSKVKPDKCPDCKGVNITQDEDVLDTWFSSWLWPFVTFGWPKNTRELKSFYPTSCLVTASEILFFWVARMIIAGLTFTRRIPFSDVIIHGTVRDERGVKMSKSLGNTIDPLEIIDEFGADALRFSLILLAAGGSDVYLNREKFLVGRNFANKVWNATRFILSKVKENNLVIDNLKLNGLDSVDTWALSELNSAAGEVSRRLDQYAFNEAAKKVYDFFWHLVCDWYIEIVKDDFTLNKAKVSVYLLLNSIKLLHPFMPFISEEIFLLIKSSTQLDLAPMLVGSDWPRRPTFKGKRQQLERINSLVTAIRNLRNVKADLGLGQKKVTLEVCLDAEGKKLWEENIGWIERLTLSKTIVFKRELSRVLYRQENLALNLDIESADLNTFLASLDKKIRGLEVILQKSGQRLKNDNFLSQAASTIVENEKQKFAEVSANCSRMKQLKDAFK
jgi:valyl-tRNA synthetase